MNPLPSLYGHIWAIKQSYYRAMSHAMATRQLDIERFAEVAREAAEKRQQGGRKSQAIAVVPVVGPIENRPSFMGEYCGWPSSMALADAVESLVADKDVKAIVLDADTPGGVATGIPEAAMRIRNARGTKPIIAVANGMAASAGYWLASAADRLYVTPSGEVGSIGVFSVHIDESKAMEQEGVKATIIKAGKYKAEFNPYEPLSTDAHDYEQASVDAIYADFLHAVASHRGKSVATVRSDFGEGRTVGAKKAVEVGMADGVATMQQVVGKIQSGRLSMSAIERGAAIDFETDRTMESETRRRRFSLRERA